MSNYGNPNGRRPGNQQTSAPAGQSPYMGYQQNGYQNMPNPSGYQTGSNAGGYQQGQNPYQGYSQPQQTPYPGNGQNPYAYPGTQTQYTRQPYGQSYPQNGMPYQQGQQPYAPNGYAPFPNPQSPYGGQPQGYQGTQRGQQQGYAGQSPYAGGGYPPQGQMPQQGGYTQGQMPQQGGYRQGNPQQRKPARLRKMNLPIESEWLVVIIGALVLVGLFVAALVSSVQVLKWLFLACAVVALAYIWIRPVLQPGPKLTASVLIGVAALVTALSMFLTPGADRTTENRATPTDNAAVAQATDDLAAAAVEEEGLGAWDDVQSVQVSAPTPTPDTASATLENLSSFFYFWSVNNIENMLNYCAPSWVKNQAEPKVALFQVLSNRIAKSYTLGTPSGTDNDISRTVAVTATVDKQNGDSYSIFVFNVIMLKENDTWYVDPRSLQSHEEVEATTFSAVITQPPTPQPAEPSLTLYYNPDGGSYYHADPNCEAVAEKYRPLSGTFTFGQIKEPAYADLKTCQRCAAPMRPAN